MADELEDAIEQNALGPRRYSRDGESVEQHSIADQIAARKHSAGAAAVAKAPRGLRFSKIVPPGAV